MSQATNEPTDDTLVTEFQAELALDDLPTADEQTAQVKGGRTGGPGQDGPVLNHNETTVEDAEEVTEALEDLVVEQEQAGQTVGGAVRVGKLLGVNY